MRRHRVLFTFAIGVLTLIAVACALAAGFFVLPVVVGVVGWLLFYWALRHQGARNPLAPPDEGPSGRWADGQPMFRVLEHEDQGRAIEHERVILERERAAKRAHDEAEREEARSHTEPGDFEGPPPVNPFP